MSLDEAILHAEEVADRCAVTDGNIQCETEHRQLAAWLRELQARRKADSCEGCKHRTGGDRFWICQKCRRQYEDKYEAERRTDE